MNLTRETFNPHAFTEGRLYWMYCISPIEYTGVFLCTEVTDEEAIFVTIVCTSGTAPSAKNRFYICNENYQNFIRIKLMCTLVGLDWNTGTEKILICVDDFGMRNKSNNSGIVRAYNKISLTKE